jgi:nickel transport system permease protein
MKNYIAKRILTTIPLLLCITFICFVFINLIPSDPAEVALRIRQTPVITDEAIQAVRLELGLDDPFLLRYLNWLGDSLHFDFGVSYTNPSRTVLGEIARCLPATLQLAGASLLIVILLSLPIGFFCAVYKDSWFDRLVRGLVFMTTAMPAYWVGLLLIWLVSIRWNLLPTSGAGSWQHLVLPAFTVALT